MIEQTRTAHVRIEGRVQGVGYRAWMEGAAAELGLAGWVRNRRDGAVEAVFQGPADDLADMLERCATGPAWARVDRVEVLAEVLGEAAGRFDGFAVRPTA